jgi:hypothetical protein
MTRFRLFCAITLAAIVSSSMQPSTEAMQVATLERALGTWHSTEQFEGEPRVQFAFRRQGNEVVGWVVMLGQNRKGNDRTVLALSFCDVRWDGASASGSTASSPRMKARSAGRCGRPPTAEACSPQ